MSFILDALKKSENDRQRQSGPALFEVRVAPPRSKFPLLAVAIVSLLVVNLGVVGWLMLRKPAEAAVPPVQVAATPPPPAYSAAPTMVPPSQPPASQVPSGPQGAYNGGPAQNGNGYPPPAPNNGYFQGNNGQGNNGQPNSGYPQQSGNNGFAPASSAGAFGGAATDEPSLAEQGAAAGPQANPDDYEPAQEAPPPGTGAGGVVRSTASGLPTYEEAATRASIPPLHIDLHSYAPDPSKRFVLINMKRMYEGQTLPEGPKVESITNDAVILSFQGTRFVMDKD
jgi:general secretion pathway protein B